MSSIICSSQSSRPRKRLCAKDKVSAATNARLTRHANYFSDNRIVSTGLNAFKAFVIGLGLGLPFAHVAFAKVAPDAEVEVIERPVSIRPAPSSQQKFKFGVLGSFEFKTAKHRFQKDWRNLLTRFEGERTLYERCRQESENCPPKLRQWHRLIDDLRGLPKSKQLAKLNRSLNRMVSYTDDSVAFGKRDHWATPAEFFQNRGDCEDFAIVKFLSLLELGFENDKLRIVIVKDRRRRLMHAVVSVTIDDTVLVLDNLNDHPVQHQYVLKYVPIYSANLDTQWAHIVTNKMRAAFVTEVMKKIAKAKRPKSIAGKAGRVSSLEKRRGSQLR